MSSVSNGFEEFGIFALLSSSICFVWMTIMLIHFIYHEWFKKKDTRTCFKLPMHSKVALTSLIFFILYIIHSIILSSYWIFYAKPNKLFNSMWCLSYYLHPILFFCGKIAMNMFWFVRIHQVFKNSLFMINPSKLKIMAISFTVPIIIITIGICFIWWASIKSVLHHSNRLPNINSFPECIQDNQRRIDIIITWFIVVIYCLNELLHSIVVLRLFVSTVLKLAVFTREIQPQSSNLPSSLSMQTNPSKDIIIQSKPNSNKHKNCNKITKMMHNPQRTKHSIYLKVSIKTANLLIFSVFCNYIALIKFIMRLPSWFFIFIILFNFIAMYLSFSFASKAYRCIFSPFKGLCYFVCAKICYSCCLPTKVPDDLQLSVHVSHEMKSVDTKPKCQSPLDKSNKSNESSIVIGPTLKDSKNNTEANLTITISSRPSISIASHVNSNTSRSNMKDESNKTPTDDNKIPIGSDNDVVNEIAITPTD